MPKKRTEAWKQTFQTSKPTVKSFTTKNLLLLTVCFAVFHPTASAQKSSLDKQVLIEIMEHRSDGGTRFFKGISNTTQTVSTIVPLTVLAVGVISNDKPILKKGLYMVETAAVSAFVCFAMKQSFKRDRPYNTHPDIIPVGTSSSPSFPSGHTSTAFSTATSLTIAFPKWYVVVPAYAWAASVGYSRMYLGVHYPSDVLAGAVIGAGSAWLMYKANKWLFKKKVSIAATF